MRLSGGQRIGIVISVLWVIVAVIYERNLQVQSAYVTNSFQINMCPSNDAIDTCLKLASEAIKENLTISGGRLNNILFFALAPVVAGWFFCYLFTKIFNWVMAGFRVKK